MKLTANEQAMLEGKYGAGAALAMEIQVAIGESFDAERMVEITRAHVATSNQEADTWFAEKLLLGGAYCKIRPTVNPGFNLKYFQQISEVAEEDAKMMERTHNTYKGLGAVLTYDCTPYLGSNIPHLGEIIAFSESSATPYVNAVWGARSNREASQSALCAAITGVVPEFGLLLDENRKGDILVRVEADMKSDFEYQLLGFTGKKIGIGVPVFVGLPAKISPEALMNLGAQLNTSGAFGMYHIPGITPEAPTPEVAFGGKKPVREVVITNKDLKEILEYFSPASGTIEFALLGCPLLTISQVRDIALVIENKKLKVPMFVLVNSLTKELAKRMGYLDAIREAGGHLVEDTCMDQPPFWHSFKGKVGVTESPKCAFYMNRREMTYIVRDIETCVEAAIKGEVK
ncbi:MAG: hypothetical protein AWM53_01480 [Candidatus Dichloromethanomonas elyunquensis]|nr:MAG: hypothetical protein AWM53_01480 [Candidatus Dichloromethanomonas elyunquensis]